MTLAATAPTTNESESLATDISGIVGPSHALDPEDERNGHPLVGKWPATARLQTVAAAGHLPPATDGRSAHTSLPGARRGCKPPQAAMWRDDARPKSPP